MMLTVRTPGGTASDLPKDASTPVALSVRPDDVSRDFELPTQAVSLYQIPELVDRDMCMEIQPISVIDKNHMLSDPVTHDVF